MSRDSSAKSYENSKLAQQKKACERYQSHSKEEKEKKSDSMVVNDKKIY